MAHIISQEKEVVVIIKFIHIEPYSRPSWKRFIVNPCPSFH
jgi:hypothetical protein